METMSEDNLEDYPDRIADTYADKTLFITGGTGFMGKVLIEKLLRCCTNVKRIYLLIRFKKDKDPYERLEELFDSPLFDTLKGLRGVNVLKKVVPICGNCELEDLGLTENSRNLILNEVEMIYHCAATIRFDETLKKAVLLNVRGTKLMLDLAKECKKLILFCHLSTAYCHLHERVLYEKAYPPPASPHKVIKAMEWMNEETAGLITNKILGDIPNTYAFTKALAEALVNDEINNLPIIILRPSIVIPIWREPLPGWTDNINGPTGLLIGAGKGVLRTMYCKPDSYGDYLPVDIAINGILCTSADYLIHRSRRIYNLTSSSEYKISWQEIINMGRSIINKRMPLNWVVWYPGGSMKRHRFVHNICFFLFHLIPALLVDGLLLLFWQKPVLLRVQKRILKGFEVFEYYANNQWDFNNDETLMVRKLMNPRERKLYKVDGEGVNYYDYFYDCVHAARLYILNESDESLPTARRHMKVMWLVDKLFKFLIIFGLVYYIGKKFY